MLAFDRRGIIGTNALRGRSLDIVVSVVLIRVGLVRALVEDRPTLVSYLVGGLEDRCGSNR